MTSFLEKVFQGRGGIREKMWGGGERRREGGKDFAPSKKYLERALFSPFADFPIRVRFLNNCITFSGLFKQHMLIDFVDRRIFSDCA